MGQEKDMSKKGQEEAAKALFATWREILLRYGAIAANMFVEQYAKRGSAEAFKFKDSLDGGYDDNRPDSNGTSETDSTKR